MKESQRPDIVQELTIQVLVPTRLPFAQITLPRGMPNQPTVRGCGGDLVPVRPASIICRISLERVRSQGLTDVMAVQRYPVRRPATEGGTFEERWTLSDCT